MDDGLVAFPLADGGTVLVQVDDAPARGGVTRGWGERDQRVVQQAQHSFEQAVSRVQPAIQGLIRELRSLAETPEEIQVEFGVQLSADVGAFVAGVSTSGNFRVSMTWQRHPPSRDT